MPELKVSTRGNYARILIPRRTRQIIFYRSPLILPYLQPFILSYLQLPNGSYTKNMSESNYALMDTQFPGSKVFGDVIIVPTWSQSTTVKLGVHIHILFQEVSMLHQWKVYFPA